MRIVHFADVHLGVRQYQRQTPTGMNLREADVAQALTRAIDLCIARAPDVVLVAGDVFHHVRPTNPAILHAFAQFARLRHALPATDVVMIAGNHDTPRSSETVCILRLFSQLGVHVVEGRAQRLRLRDGALGVLAVPDVPALPAAFDVDPGTRYNVLLMHADAEAVLADRLRGERAAPVVPPATLEDVRWDYVALGHYHVHRPVGPRAWYAGALDYTSTDPWSELRAERVAGLPGKGIVEVDLATHRVVFHALPPGRVFLDLAPIDAQGVGAEALDAMLRDAVDAVEGGIDDKVVRLVVRNVPRPVARDLGQQQLRDWRRRAVHFHLDLRRPEQARTGGSGAPGHRPTLVDAVRARLVEHPLDGELARERFVTLGLGFLDAASAQSTATPLVEDA